MAKNLDLTKILADCPKGTKLFSTEYGYVKFLKISTDEYFPIVIKVNANRVCYTKDGYSSTKEYRDEYAEPSLYPAHDQRDWSKFKVPNRKVEVTLHPFDKVLVKLTDGGKWKATLITDFDETDISRHYSCLYLSCKHCIPYNKDTAHLLGTYKDCPIDYEIEFSKEFKE